MTFNRKNPQFQQWCALGLLLLVLGTGLAATTYQNYKRTGAREHERLLTQARVVQENLSWNLATLNKALINLAREKKILTFDPSYNHRLEELNDAMPGVRTILVLDAKGISRLANRPAIIGQDFSKRDYFARPRQKNNPELLYVSPPFKTSLNTFVINVSRIIQDSKGDFAGVVAASLDPDYFKTLLGSVRYEEDMWTAIAHGDGMLFLIVPDRSDSIGKDLSTPDSFFSRHLAGGKSSTIGSGLVKMTGEMRMIALQTIQPENLKMDRPLVVSATRDLWETYRVWRMDTLLHSTLYLLFSIISVFLLNFYQKRQLEIEHHKTQADKNIKALSEELDRFFSMTLDMLCISDLEGHFKRLNRSWEETLGYTLDELIGQRLLDFIHPEDVPATLATMADLSAEKPVLNFINRYRCKDGSYRWIEWRSSPYQNLVYAAARDITERIDSEQSLAKSERFMRVLTDIIPGMVGYWNSDLRCGFANIAYLEWFGKTPEEMRGIHIRDLMGEELFRKNEPYISAALQGKLQKFERTLTKADGSAGYTWAHYIPDIVGDQVRGFFVLVSDVTELKQAHVKLEQLNEELVKRTAEAENANRAKSEFLANMSHEIRTPMNAILGLTRIVLDLELAPKQRDYLQKVYRSSNALMLILNDILDYSKIEAGKLELESLPICVADILSDTAELFSARLEEKGLEIRIETNPELPEVVMGDPLRITQILNNLVGNAVKFTETGVVTLKVEPVSEDGEQITLRFCVQDTGIGLSKEQSDRLFQAFTQADGTISRKYGGTGLGLTISQRLVRLMGGEIQVSSIEGKGATFTFTITVGKALPGAHAARKRRNTIEVRDEHSSAAKMNRVALRGARILLVEDNRINQEVASEFLRARGAVVTLADHGAQALEIISRPAFDLVLMDLHMPVMDGFEATRRIREIRGNEDLPIIAMTAAVMQDDRERCKASGMVDFVAKPINPDELASVLQKWLKSAETIPVTEQPAESQAQIESMPGFDIPSALRRMNGNKTLLCFLFQEFVKEHEAAAVRMKTLLASGLTDEAPRLAHTIKGVAGTVGATRLAEAAAKLEAELRAGEEPLSMQRFEQELAGAVAAIRAAFPAEPVAESDNNLSVETAQDVAPLLSELTGYLREQELVPDELLSRLRLLSDSAATGPSGQLKTLLRQLDNFDHAGAMETVKRLTGE